MATVDSSSKILKSVMIIKVCRVDIQLQQFAQDNVKLVPDKMALLTNTVPSLLKARPEMMLLWWESSARRWP